VKPSDFSRIALMGRLKMKNIGKNEDLPSFLSVIGLVAIFREVEQTK
jgi:hypothetical protein